MTDYEITITFNEFEELKIKLDDLCTRPEKCPLLIKYEIYEKKIENSRYIQLNPFSYLYNICKDVCKWFKRPDISELLVPESPTIDRVCFNCGKKLIYEHVKCDKKVWNSENVELYCCKCYNEEMAAKQRNVKFTLEETTGEVGFKETDIAKLTKNLPKIKYTRK